MAVEAIAGILTVLALGVLFYGPWQWICTDMARQKAFEKRDAIFDIAARGDLDFGSAEYRNIRDALEKLIRFAHELTLPNFVHVLLFYRVDVNTVKTELFSSLENVENESVKDEVMKNVLQAFAYTIIWTFLRSAVGLLFVLPLFFGLKMFKDTKSMLLNASKLVQAEAEAFDRVKVS